MIVRYARRALLDLEGILAWIAVDDPIRADSYVDELIDTCEGLADFPNRYPRCRFKSRRPLRQCIHDNYLILFEVRAAEVEIVAITHGARNINALLD